MKKSILLAGMLIAFMASVTFYSCTKEELTETKSQHKITKSILSGILDASSVGEVHNRLLDDYFKDSNPKLETKNYLTQTAKTDSIFGLDLQTLFDSTFFCLDAYNLHAEHLTYVANTVTADSASLDTEFDDFMTKLSDVNGTDVLSSDAKTLMATYKNILFTTPYVNLKTEIVIFDSTVKASTTLTDTDVELLLSLSTITSSSDDYWTNASVPNPQKFIVGDCVGFLAGWGSSVWDEVWSTGHLSESNSTHRIGSGLIWGAAGSVCSPI